DRGAQRRERFGDGHQLHGPRAPGQGAGCWLPAGPGAGRALVIRHYGARTGSLTAARATASSASSATLRRRSAFDRARAEAPPPGLEDGGRDALTRSAAPAHLEHDRRLAEGVLAARDCVDPELAEPRVAARGRIDGAEDRIDRSVTGERAGHLLAGGCPDPHR